MGNYPYECVIRMDNFPLLQNSCTFAIFGRKIESRTENSKLMSPKGGKLWENSGDEFSFRLRLRETGARCLNSLCAGSEKFISEPDSRAAFLNIYSRVCAFGIWLEVGKRFVFVFRIKCVHFGRFSN